MNPFSRKLHNQVPKWVGLIGLCIFFDVLQVYAAPRVAVTRTVQCLNLLKKPAELSDRESILQFMKEENDVSYSENALRNSALNTASMRMNLKLENVEERSWHWSAKRVHFDDSAKTFKLELENTFDGQKLSFTVPMNSAESLQADYFLGLLRAKKELISETASQYWERQYRLYTDPAQVQFLKLAENNTRIYADSISRYKSLCIDQLLRASKGKNPDRTEIRAWFLDFIKASHSEDVYSGGRPIRSYLPFVSSLYPSFWSKQGTKYANKADRPIRHLVADGLEGLIFDFTQIREFSFNHDEAFDVFLSLVFFQEIERKQNSLSFGYTLSLLQDENRSLNIHFVDGGKLRQLERTSNLVTSQFKALPEDIRNYIARSYTSRLNISKADLDRLMEISAKMEERTQYIFLSEEPYANLRTRTKMSEHPFFENERITVTETRNFEHFKIKGSMSIVRSQNADEALPLELFTGYRIKRKTSLPIYELGRFSSDPGNGQFGPKQIWKMAQLIASTHSVEKVVAETTKEYAEELIEKFGFKKVFERLNFEGKPEYIIEAFPSDLFDQAFKRRPAP